MALTAVLAAVFVFLLFYQAVQIYWLVGLSLALGCLLFVSVRHHHGGISAIDAIAQRSALQAVHRRVKFFFSLGLLVLCVTSNSVYTGLVVLLICAVLTVYVGKVSWHAYLSLLSIPLSFLLLSCLAILFAVSKTPSGVLCMPLWDGLYLVVTQQAQQTTLLLCMRALGGLASLYMLSLSTTMTQIIAQCKACKVPALIIELMYLMYRYIFIISAVHHRMSDAAKSRLGFAGYRRQVKTTGIIYANLLAQSVRQASRCFDAMESRGYDGQIAFLEREVPVKMRHLVAFFALFAIAACVAVCGAIYGVG